MTTVLRELLSHIQHPFPSLRVLKRIVGNLERTAKSLILNQADGMEQMHPEDIRKGPLFIRRSIAIDNNSQYKEGSLF
jgi:hypothetical protein